MVKKVLMILLGGGLVAGLSLPALAVGEVELHKLTASDAAARDWFGSSVALSGATALVGAPRNDDAGMSSGSAYLFDVATGSQIAKLTASDAAFGDWFGYSVALSGSTALVGAPWDDSSAGAANLGSAYLYDFSDPFNPVQIAKLTASDAFNRDYFGWSVALSGAIALVGARLDDDGGDNSGSVYLFDVTTGSQIAKLTASDATANDVFGVSVALSGSTALVGAYGNDDAGNSSGSAYLFDVSDPFNPVQIAKLTAFDAAAGDQFGFSVALSGTTALVGAWLDDDAGNNSGSAYLYDFTDLGNIIETKLTASDAAADDIFGSRVALGGTTALVGAHWDDDTGTDSGSAYLFDVATGNQIAKLTASDAATGDYFGSRVALGGTTALVGAYLDDDACPGDIRCDSGSAYLFRLTPFGLPDFSIKNIDPVQVVWNSDINGDGKTDLVLGKETAIFVDVDIKGEFEEEYVEVQVLFEGEELRDSFRIEDLRNEPAVFYHTPTEAGDQEIVAVVDPDNVIDESNENNNAGELTVTVKDTHGLHLMYFKVERPGSYGEVISYSETVAKSGEFINGTYPISTEEFVNEETEIVVKGWIEAFPLIHAMYLDCRKIGVTAKRLGSDRGVGIVPSDYFIYHGRPGNYGLTWPWLKGVMVMDEFWAVAAHEIGHTYGLPPGAEEEYGENYDGNPANGFWVAKKQPMEDKICFMGVPWSWRTFDNAWVDDEDYKYLFRTFRVDKRDPEVLLLDGIVHKDGTIELGKWFKIEGKDDLDDISPGDYSLQILDTTGMLLHDIKFDTDFYASLDPEGAVETDFAPFSFAVPYAENAATAQIQYIDETLVEVDLGEKLFEDAMNSLIPDYETLITTIEKAEIEDGVKNSLLSKLTEAKDRAEQGLQYIEDGHNDQAKDMLKEASNIVGAFINEVSAQKGNKISDEYAEQFTTWAERMILMLQTQIMDSL